MGLGFSLTLINKFGRGRGRVQLEPLFFFSPWLHENNLDSDSFNRSHYFFLSLNPHSTSSSALKTFNKTSINSERAYVWVQLEYDEPPPGKGFHEIVEIAFKVKLKEQKLRYIFLLITCGDMFVLALLLHRFKTSILKSFSQPEKTSFHPWAINEGSELREKNA